MNDPERHDSDDEPICGGCIGDLLLRDRIQNSGRTAACLICGAIAPWWGARQYAKLIQPLFQNRFVPEAPEYTRGELLMPTGASAAEVIQEMTKCGDDRTAELILESLRGIWPWWPQDGEQDPLDDELRFSLDRRASGHSFLWTEIEEELRTSSRYLNPTIEAKLHEMFEDIGTIVSGNGGQVSGAWVQGRISTAPGACVSRPTGTTWARCWRTLNGNSVLRRRRPLVRGA
ncbi:hypothetical protein [Burkholderia cenocepacia]|uniref:hypothetical protein n=1 Tax=Burkholderia cenocepacia TaxID=95486 RepID=UPI0028625C78|nr:hypothetical protein [Burkholderia cenocepacia]MDR5645492.1 hypothetical protein [Burkholderia cenocepacia]